MFCVGLKFLTNRHTHMQTITKYGCTRSHFTFTWRKLYSRDIGDHHMIKVDKGFQYRSKVEYSSETLKSKNIKIRNGLLLMGSITIGTIGVLVAAKNDHNTKATLEKWIPGIDKILKIFQEENLYFDHIVDCFNYVRQSAVSVFGNGMEQDTMEKDEVQMGLGKKAPEAASAPIIETVRGPSHESQTSSRLGIDNVTDGISNGLKSKDLQELENSCQVAVTELISAHKKALEAVMSYNNEVINVVENSEYSTDLSSSVWKRLKEAAEKKKYAVEQAEECEAKARQSLNQLSNLVDDSQSNTTQALKSTVRSNVKQISAELNQAKTGYEEKLRSCDIGEQFWNKVETARQNFNDELQILFPNANFQDKHVSISERAFDLFVLYMYKKVLNLQFELARLETFGNTSLAAALASTGDFGTEKKNRELVHRELLKERRLLQEKYEKKMLMEKQAFEEEFRRILKLHTQLNADHTKEILDMKEKEIRQQMNLRFSEQLESEAYKYKSQLAIIIGRLRGLHDALKVRLSEGRGASDAQILWAACQTLAGSIEDASGTSNGNFLLPLEAAIKDVLKVAPKEDTLIETTLGAIPETAVMRGVFPQDAMRQRFSKVEAMAQRLAIVPEVGASLPIYVLSYVQHVLLIKASNFAAKNESPDELINLNKLDTFDVLHKARYWLDRGDLKMVLRYMNLLKGAPKCVAHEWIEEVKLLLATQQAVDTLLTYASAIAFVFVNNTDAKVIRK